MLKPIPKAPLRLVLGSLLVLSANGSLAWAQETPHLATDGVYVGARLDPGVALLGAWDLDVYIDRARILSLGLGLSFSALGTTVPDARTQDFLLRADFLRVKLGYSLLEDRLRIALVAGGGIAYARLRAASVTRTITDPTTGLEITGQESYPQEDVLDPAFAVGLTGDYYFAGPVGISLLLLEHIHPVGSNRLPEVWTEAALGLRFGL